MGARGKVGLGIASIALLTLAWYGLPRVMDHPGRREIAEPNDPPPRREGAAPPSPSLAAAPSVGREAEALPGLRILDSDAPTRREVAAPAVIAANQRTTAADVLEVVCLGSPTPEAYTVELEPVDPDPRAPTRTMAIGSDGVGRLAGISPGSYRIRVHGPHGLHRTLHDVGRIPGDALVNYTLTVVVGDGAVRGRLFDRDGEPVRRRAVTLSTDPWTNLGGTSVHTQTDEEGRYAFPGLRSGSYRLAALLSAPPDDDSRVDAFTLAAGEEKELDLGSARPEPRWSGTARLSSGTLLSAPVRIFLIEASRGMPALWVPLDTQGAFSARLPTGTYDGQIDFSLHSHRFPLAIGDADLAQDLKIPGVRVSGVLRRERPNGGSHTADSGVTGHRVRIRLADAEDADSNLISPDPSGLFAFDAVPPGRYRLLATPPPGSPFGEASLLVEVGDAHDVTGLVLEALRR